MMAEFGSSQETQIGDPLKREEGENAVNGVGCTKIRENLEENFGQL